MATNIRAHVLSLMLLAVGAAFIATPDHAAAKPKYAAPAPEIFTMAVTGDEGVRAGADLEFSLEGTPRGKVSVVLGKSNIVVGLKETSSGMYRGTYTVRSRDRIDTTQMMTGRLTSGSRTLAQNFAWPATFQPAAVAAAKPAAAAPPAQRIENFRMWPAQRIEPGRELHFLVLAGPGGAATVDIPGVVNGLALHETAPGRYEGTYTVRQKDDVNAFGHAVATLRGGGQIVNARLSTPVMRDTDPPTIANVAPRPGEVMPRGSVLLAGTFDDHGGRGVDPATVRITVSGRNVTPQARITPNDFSVRGDLPPGRYTAEVTAKDHAGNAVNKTWNFEVAAGASAAAPAGPVPVAVPLLLSITTPAQNAQLDASGHLNIQGRTAPGALVTVHVEAISPVIGNRGGLIQPAVTETVQADRNGYFMFNMVPRALPIPGTRFDVKLTSSHNSQTAEQRLTVFQRQG